MANLGAPELLIILTIGVLLFGATRLPKVAGGLGEAIRELRHATDDEPQAARPADPPSSSTSA